MKQKKFIAPVKLKQDGKQGEFRAVFSRFNTIDHDGDVTLPGAFKDGQPVRISYWGHRWQDLPVGKGTIHQDEEKAWVDGRFFMDTIAGKETYHTVKNLGELQEWSYGYDIVKSSRGEFEDQDVQFLEELETFEISPVMLGAGIDTVTEFVKELKPYPSEHACRLRDPDDFQADSFRRIQREHEGKTYSIIMGRLEGEDSMTEQAYRYPKDVWEEDIAREHCKDHDGSFEPAADKSAIEPQNDPEGKGDGGNAGAKPSGVDLMRTRIDILEIEAGVETPTMEDQS